MKPALLLRQQILESMAQALQPLDYTCAMWEGGAASFDRVDEWSDIDLQIDVEDDHVSDTLEVVERTLLSLSPIDMKYELPQPAWHGHAQTFYRLQNASPFLLIDLVVMRHSSANKFLEPEIHGEPVVLFDKTGVTSGPHLDLQAHAGRMQERLAVLRTLFDLFQVFTLKELNRGNDVEALGFYQAYTLRPLVEALRIQNDPARHNFHTRYIQYDLPPEIAGRLKTLFFVKDAHDLRAKHLEAQEWFYRLIEQIS
jgi:hypothetical protein